ncbi:hypothetical protein HYALB_00011749 [Hymenoscyphus albidus]|uniref:Uncharacterized protein n=1 Tax=Hymenoscyphus albidus TaxID=595503 RepID=A0A9N9LQE9_9HELO|nr:hypothetical protein HYALB_00011749 [Hymenoscyphus albidus]
MGRQGFRGHIRAYRYTIVEGMKVYEDMGIEDVRLMTIFIFTRIFNINISRNLSLIIFKGTANWITAWIVHGFKDQQIVQEVKISKTHPIFTNPNSKISWISQRLDQEQGKPGNIKAGYLTQIPFDQDVPGWPRETRDQWAILNLKTVLVARGDRGHFTAPQFEAFYKFGK